MATAALLLLAVLVGPGPGPASAPVSGPTESETARDTTEPVQGSRSAFMRKKLDFAQGVLEGITLEQFDLVARNARALKVLSQAAEWEVPTIPNVEQYLPHTTQFQRICDDLTASAARRDVDGATQAYVRLTLNCVDCHKYVRSVTTP